MRKHALVNESYYHIYNRGVDKRDIFMDIKDVNRFLICMEMFAYEKPVRSIRDELELQTDARHQRKELKGKKLVSFVAYCLNPNHFHFLIKQEVEGGISEFMKRLMGGYTKYFNNKYKRSGALFQGTFKSSVVETDTYFRLLLAYVMWNNLMHDIPENKKYLIKSSSKEYEQNFFYLISEEEAKEFLSWFGDYKDLFKSSKEVLRILKLKRKGLDIDRIELSFHED